MKNDINISSILLFVERSCIVYKARLYPFFLPLISFLSLTFFSAHGAMLHLKLLRSMKRSKRDFQGEEKNILHLSHLIGLAMTVKISSTQSSFLVLVLFFSAFCCKLMRLWDILLLDLDVILWDLIFWILEINIYLDSRV